MIQSIVKTLRNSSFLLVPSYAQTYFAVKIIFSEKFCSQAIKWHIYSNTVKPVKPSIPGRFNPHIKNIKSKKINLTFSFENTYTDLVKKIINNLNVAKSCQMNDTPTKVIKINIFPLISLWTTSITALLMVNSLMS